ncbi:hypothetical protein CYLTODRAFT_426026 [Cylindrobasidium torrendii FP15055 ss-10]|uniref:Receptor-activated Ca2+-permeable cation channel n=1 Tax=Cylindrobasidium torrendii FP15055 ss-10 TaxID=1314674 RepID=A0A0D7B1Y6_9AGAR|nr:hypothetical protein CYLTODRAFT_426026 [Cylindrobasidium torrendii FP15055 ss-10]
MDPEDSSPLLAPSPELLSAVKVFPLIISIKNEVMTRLDSALSWEQLTASDINFAVVRPIVFKYAKLKNMSSVYACLVVRSYFLNAAEEELAYAGLMLSRASLCEILAMKLLGTFATNHIHLVAVLTTVWNPLAGASHQIIDDVCQLLGSQDDDINSPQSALEMAIATEAKQLISSPVTQKVVNDIYSGRIIFSIASNRSMLADNYKPRAIEVYDVRNAPFLDHYRLRVPRYGAILEFLNFVMLLVTFVLCLSTPNMETVAFWEMMFLIFAAAFALEEYTATMEHGWIIYIANMWNAFDAAFLGVFFIYLGFRIRGLVSGDAYYSETAFDVLACAACILFPRLAFFTVSNNVVILSLRVMIKQFVFFIGIAAICFSGLLFTLWTLGKERWTVKSIAWLMVQIWFGNTYLSFGQAASFHPLFGPILMTCFAALSNTLLLTILISILSNTVARIDANATQEYLFQFAITTIEGFKSDALFSYQPPFNILAFLLLKPASYIISPRALHSLNVFLIRLTSFPTLVVIALYERYFTVGQRIRKTGKDAAQSLFQSLPRHIKNMPFVEAIVGSTSNDLYEAIFDVEHDHADADIFQDADSIDERPQLRSYNSAREDPPPSPRVFPGSPRSRSRVRALSINTSHRMSGDMTDAQALLTAVEPAPNVRSPLGRLWARLPSANDAKADATLRKVETILDELKGAPVNQLREEMKELQERQARIENLLLMLTRGMRNETMDSTI